MPILLATICLHLLLLTFTKFTLWPEMVVYPYLVNHNFLLYKDLINPYPPYLILLLGLVTGLFGYDALLFRAITFVLIILIDILIYVISSKIFKNRKTAIINTLFFVVFSIPFGVNGLWFDLFQTPLILLGAYFLTVKKTEKNILIAGIFLLTAALLKQQVFWLVPFYLFIAFKNTKSIKILITKVLGPLSLIAATSIILTLALVYFEGSLNQFIKWVVVLPLLKTSALPGYVLLPTFKQLAIPTSLFVLFLPSVILHKKVRVIYVLALGSVLFAYPRFDFFHLIPSLALLSLLATSNFLVRPKNKMAVTCYLFVVPLLIFSLKVTKTNIGYQTRFFEPDLYQAAGIINGLTNPNDRLYIQNGPDQLLVLSSRLPVKPWADEFPWYLEYENTQQEIVNAINDQKPKYIIYKTYLMGEKYLLGAYQPQKISLYSNDKFVITRNLPGGLFLKESRN